MTIYYINTGSSANKGDGDTLRTAFNKINLNFQSLESLTASGVAVQTTSPTNPVEGQLWWSPNTAILAIYSSGAWVDTAPMNGGGSTGSVAIATNTSLGVVKGSYNILVLGDGSIVNSMLVTATNGISIVASAPDVNGYHLRTWGLLPATDTTLGGVKGSPSILIDPDGTIQTAYINTGSQGLVFIDTTTAKPGHVIRTWHLLPATTSTLGAVKYTPAGAITVDADGVLDFSVTFNNGTGTQAHIVWPNDGITTPTIAYNLLPATTSTIGGVKAGYGLDIGPDGTISATGVAAPVVPVGDFPPGSPSDGALWWDSATNILYIRYSNVWVEANPSGGSSYTLTTASTSVLGGVIIGAGINIDGNGVISVTTGTGALLPATPSVLGGIKVGNGLSISGDGTLSANGTSGTAVVTIADTPPTPPYEGELWWDSNTTNLFIRYGSAWIDAVPSNATQYQLPPASLVGLGGVIVSNNINVDPAGRISVYTASTTTAGVVQIGSGITVDSSGTISVATYSLPIATRYDLGGIKIGNGFLTTPDGTISVDTSGGVPIASTTTLGGVIVGSGLHIDIYGVLTANTSSGGSGILNTATGSILGGIKIGSGLQALQDGTVFVPTANTSTAGIVKLGTGFTESPAGTINVNIGASIPVATTSTLGGIKLGPNFFVSTITNQMELTIKNTATNGIFFTTTSFFDEDGQRTRFWSLKQAAVGVFGGVSIGNNININTTTAAISVPYASTTTAGVVKLYPGGDFTTDADGTLHLSINFLNGTGTQTHVVWPDNGVTPPTLAWDLLPATTSTLGGVKVDGTSVTINQHGVISAMGGATFTATNISYFTNDIGYLTSSTLSAYLPADNDSMYLTSTNVLSLINAHAFTVTNVGYFSNDVGYLTSGTVNQYVNNFTVTNVGYFSNDVGYLTSGTVNQYVNNFTVTNVGYFSNDVGYLTSSTLGAYLPVDIDTMANIIQSSTAPTGTTSTIWYDTVGGRAYVYYNNAWVDANPSIAYTLPTASTSTLGGVKIGSGIKIAFDGTISVTTSTPYVLTTATTGALGGVKIDGTTIVINGNGVISAVGGGGSTSTWASLAGKVGQSGPTEIALGYTAGFAQGANSIALGNGAGQGTQSAEAVAIGHMAAQNGQGTNAIAIGSFAGQNNQPANSIIINASGVKIDGSAAGFFVSPVRQDTFTGNIAYYNTTTNEITYAPVITAPPSQLSSGTVSVTLLGTATNYFSQGHAVNRGELDFTTGTYLVFDSKLNASAWAGAIGDGISTSSLGLFTQNGPIELIAGSYSNKWDFNTNGTLVLPPNGTVSYTPATPSNWNGTAPTTIEEAINRLAAAVKALNGTGA
jgi:hypothetical protein